MVSQAGDYRTGFIETSRVSQTSSCVWEGEVVSRSKFGFLAALAGCALFAAPSFAVAPSFAAAPLNLAAYRGRVVYLDFWASWCGPCKQSFPWMQSMNDTYARRGLVVLAVDLDRHKHNAARFLAAFKPDFHILYDPSGSLAARYKVQGMPTSLVIDRQGKVRYRHIGFMPADADHYERQVETLLAKKK